MTTNNWKVNADGDWATAANWSLGRIPNSSDAVTISTANVHTITHSGGSDFISKLTVGQDVFVMGGGSLDISTSATFADGYTQTGGVLTAASLAVTGAAKLFGGAFQGATAVTVTGTTTLTNFTIGGAALLTVSAAANQTGQVALGDSTDVGAKIKVTGTGIYSISTDSGITQGNASAAFSNFGTLRKSAGAGTSLIDVSTNSTGTITAVSGNLEFRGPTNVIKGAVTGAGQVSFGAGGVTTFSATSVTVGELGLYDAATLNLGASLSFAGIFNNSTNGTTHLNLQGATLTLTGATNTILGAFGTADLNGPGTIANQGTLALGNATIDGTASLTNTGVINQVAAVIIGGGGGQIASLVNAAGGHFNVTGAYAIGNGAASASHFDNSGVVTVQAGIGTATFATTFNNLSGGVLNVATGVLASTGILGNHSTISGKTLDLTGASQTTFASGTKLTLAKLEVLASASLTLGVSLTYSGTFVDASNGNSNLNLGANTLTLKGASHFSGAFGSALVNGTGTLALAHAASLDSGTLIFGGGAHLSVQSKLTASGQLQIGDGSASAAAATITAAGTYDLTTDAGVSRGAGATSTLTNNGLFEKTGGTGTSVVSSRFVNNGTITVTSGTLEFLAGTFTNNGTINGTVTTDGSGDTLITAAAGAVKPAASGVHAMAQAAAGLGAGRGATTTASLAHRNPDLLGVLAAAGGRH